ncbi:hypothetical protein C8J57DRAFT_1578507 [Mycena rebaudengoi]|nr:hypothetical protein C8J57DRAFT_1578507 [Mycena rebaudengoi]
MQSQATTHASRNPSKQVQETRGRKKGPLTDSQKATRAVAALARKLAQEALEDDLDKFYALRNKSILDMAAAHDRDPEYIKRLIMSESQYKTTRPMTMRNALMHDFSVEAKTAGNPLSLVELHALADVALPETRSAEEEERLWAQLSAHRELHRVGLRASNAAAAADTRSLSSFMQEELASLYERTGTRGFFFLTRGHVDDATMPTFGDAGDGIKFCTEALKMQPLDIVRQFEQWSCTRDSAGTERETVATLRAQIAAIILERFHLAIRDNTPAMSYANYEVEIQEAWKVEITGWPTRIDFKSPWAVKGLERLRTLRDAWINKACGWSYMTPLQIAALAKDLKRRREANGGVLKARKARSDMGGKHASRRGAAAKGDDEEDGDDDDDDDDDDADNNNVDVDNNDNDADNDGVDAGAATVVSAAAAALILPTATHGSSGVDVAASIPNLNATNGGVGGDFIAYVPPQPLGNATNTANTTNTAPRSATGATGAKRKADAVPKPQAAKKPRKERSDKGVPRGPKAGSGGSAARSTAAGRRRPGSAGGAAAAKRPSVAAARAAGTARTDNITEAAKQRAAVVRQDRMAAAAAAQLPPTPALINSD